MLAEQEGETQMYQVPGWKQDLQRRIDALKQRVEARELKRQINASAREEKRKTRSENKA